MDPFIEERIPFVGVKEGNHDYKFHLTETFFSSFEFGEIEQSDIQVSLRLEKQSNMVQLHFEMGGTVNLPCDRCGKELKVNLSESYHQIYKYGDTTSFDDEIYILGSNEHELDVHHLLYEYAHLSLPSKRVHESLNDCDYDDDLISEDLPNDEEEGTDPRWDALKGLK
ncbi:MAG: DUF177 domain-containing protein [Bacteroidota bacterium]